jgi:hypothetical protein
VDEAASLSEILSTTENPGVADVQRTRANLLLALGRPSRAVPIAQEVLAFEERFDGPAHPFTGTALGTLCQAQWQSQQVVEGEASCKRAYDIQVKALGAKHRDTLSALANWAAVSTEAGHDADAIRLSAEAVAVAERTLSENDRLRGDLLEIHGQALLGAGELEEARLVLEKAAAFQERLLGPSHPSLGDALGLLGQVRLRQGKPAAAQKLFERAKAIAETAGGAQALAPFLAGLGEADLAMGEVVRARRELERAWASIDRAAAPNPGQRAEVQLLLGRALWSDPTARERGRLMMEQASEVLASSGPRWKARATEGRSWLAQGHASGSPH